MKINGSNIGLPPVEHVVLPREGQDIVFYCRPVDSWAEFERLCPRPQPKRIRRPGATEDEFLYDDKPYQKALMEWSARRVAYMYIFSLMATPNLSFDTVILDDPATWDNIYEELRNSGLTEYEQRRLLDAVSTANGLNDAKLEEARKRFLATKAATPES